MKNPDSNNPPYFYFFHHNTPETALRRCRRTGYPEKITVQVCNKIKLSQTKGVKIQDKSYIFALLLPDSTKS